MSDLAILLPYHNYVIQFGAVPVGTRKTKLFILKNSHIEPLTYIVTRSKETNPIYTVFDITQYEFSLKSKEKIELSIFFMPNIPNVRSCDHFEIRDSKNSFYKLCCSGKSSGPLVHCSVRYLVFECNPKQTVKRQAFFIKNSSKVNAIYHFDCGSSYNDVFEVEPLYGTIKSEEVIYVYLKFRPKTYGVYSRQLCCLILHHEPIVVNLCGIYTKDSNCVNETSLKYFTFPYEETVGFKAFLSDSVTVKTAAPPFSLSNTYIDFGRYKNTESCETFVTSLTNHLDSQIEVMWERDTTFKIFPEKINIPAKQSALYECKFEPKEESQLYSAILKAHISWAVAEGNQEQVSSTVPLTATLRFIGHSFPQNQAWIPSVTIVPSNTVILPLTLPTFPSYATFMIESRGHLPVLFKFLPPGKTHFIIKPMVGLIKNYQIIVVQLENKSNKSQSFDEKWEMELNGQNKKRFPIYIKASTDIPLIAVGNNNLIDFESAQPGTQSHRCVPIKNISSCHVQYEFLKCERFGIDQPQGKLLPGEKISKNCWFNTELQDSGEINANAKCRLQFVYNDKMLIGLPIDIHFKLGIIVNYSELCALPNSYDCGEIECGTFINVKFYLFNFGKSTLNFQLYENGELENIKIVPVTGSCASKQKVQVLVELIPKSTGQRTITIAYNCLNQYSKGAVAPEKDVFKITYYGVYPVFQVTDLVEHNFWFSKSDLWSMLRINELNSALNKTNQKINEQIHIYAPEFETSEKKFYAIFAIKNSTNFELKINLKRRKVCDCKTNSNPSSKFSISKKVDECPHKKLVNLELTSDKLPGHSREYLILKLNYLMPETNTLSYVFTMSNNRSVTVDIEITGFSPKSLMLSSFEQNYTFLLKDIFIGLREAPVQIYWFFNSTNYPISYNLDQQPIITLCNNEDFLVLQCLNNSGIAKANSLVPLLFKFWPIEAKLYNVIVDLTLGARNVKFSVKGYGVERIEQMNFKQFDQRCTVCPLRNGHLSLSLDSLTIEPIFARGCADRMFFIKNHSKENKVKYFWQPCTISGLIKIEINSAEGILQPNESQSVIITILSLSEACSIKLYLQCQYRQLSQNYNFIEKFSTENSDTNKEAEYLILSLPIFVNVVGILDRDTCIIVDDQFKQQPFLKAGLDANKLINNLQLSEKTSEINREQDALLNDADKKMTQKVLENLVSDAVFNNHFFSDLQRLKIEPNPSYSRIKFNSHLTLEKRNEIIKRHFTTPTTSEVINICKEIVADTLHMVFHLGAVKKDNYA